MFWIAIAGFAAAMAFVKLGAMSVWVGIFAAGFKLTLLVAAVLLVALMRKNKSGVTN